MMSPWSCIIMEDEVHTLYADALHDLGIAIAIEDFAADDGRLAAELRPYDGAR